MELHDFNDGNGPVPAYRHSSKGGWCAATTNVSSYAVVTSRATVTGHATVHGGCKVLGEAHVGDRAMILAHSVIRQDARVLDHARVARESEISGKTVVSENAMLRNVILNGAAIVRGNLFLSNFESSKDLLLVQKNHIYRGHHQAFEWHLLPLTSGQWHLEYVNSQGLSENCTLSSQEGIPEDKDLHPQLREYLSKILLTTPHPLAP